MKIKWEIKKVDRTLLLLGTFVLLAFILALTTGGWQLVYEGLKQAGNLVNIAWLRLLLGFILGGLIQVLIPSTLIIKWLGNTSGLKGVLIGSYIGVIMPGGPYISLPILASLYKAGAGVGPVIALLTGQMLLGIHMLFVWHIPFLGLEIPIARYIACLFIPPIVGLSGATLFQIVTKLLAMNTTGIKKPNTTKQRDKTIE